MVLYIKLQSCVNTAPLTAMTQLQISQSALLHTECAGSEYGWVSKWSLFYSPNSEPLQPPPQHTL